MKALRLSLLILLAVLLPLRTAVAAAMLCPPAGGQEQMHDQGQGHEHHAAMHAPAPQAEHDAHDVHDVGGTHGPAGSHGHGPAAQDGCQLCAAFCALTPLPASSPDAALPAKWGSATFPRIDAPAPSFLSDVAERPPRSA